MLPTSLRLTNSQHAYLLRLLCDKGTAAPKRTRAAILLLLHGSDREQSPPLQAEQVAKKAACSVWLVMHTWQRFVTAGMHAALSLPQVGRATEYTDNPSKSAAPAASSTLPVVALALDLQEVHDLVSESSTLIWESRQRVEEIRKTSRLFKQLVAASAAVLHDCPPALG